MPGVEADSTKASLQGMLSLVNQAQASAVGDAEALRKAQSDNAQLLQRMKSAVPAQQGQVSILLPLLHV